MKFTRFSICCCAVALLAAMGYCLTTLGANYTSIGSPTPSSPGSDAFRLIDSPAQAPTAMPGQANYVPPNYSTTNGPPTYAPSYPPAAGAPLQGPSGGVSLASYGPPSAEPISPPAAINYSGGNYYPGATASPYSPAFATASPIASPQQEMSTNIVQPAGSPACNCDRLTESNWYTKIEYFHWNERVGGANFETENGPFFTLGYQHRFGDERVRFEVFDSTVDSSSDIVNNLGDVEPLHSHTNYFGVRGEYDLIWNPETLPSLSFFVGLGTRFWVRDLPDDFTSSGTFVQGYQETWWTFYPYVGLETRRNLHNGIELYGMGRAGFTAITLERATINDLALYPRIGVTAQLEGGVRGTHLFAAAFAEVMTWQQSAVVSGWLQPTSTMATVGVRTGSSF